MKYFPQLPTVARHIDHYWIANQYDNPFRYSPKIRAYPGITPEIIIVLDGYYTLSYLGKSSTITQPMVYGFIHSDVEVDFSSLQSFVLITFKRRGLSSIVPFLKNLLPSELIKNPTRPAQDFFGDSMNRLTTHLRALSPDDMSGLLDEWFLQLCNPGLNGFLPEMAEELKEDFSIPSIRKITNYSYATLERYFKNETGLTPKSFQRLQRFRYVIEDLYETRNTDWQYYVTRYGFYDQSHFIREIKAYTRQTPSALLSIPGLINYRPEKS